MDRRRTVKRTKHHAKTVAWLFISPGRPLNVVRRRPLSIIPAGQGRCASLDFGWCVESAEASHDATHKGRTIISQLKTFMSYIEQFEAELVKKLDGSEDTATIVRWI